eukprot:42388-Rhodomonas_salina.2
MTRHMLLQEHNDLLRTQLASHVVDASSPQRPREKATRSVGSQASMGEDSEEVGRLRRELTQQVLAWHVVGGTESAYGGRMVGGVCGG